MGSGLENSGFFLDRSSLSNPPFGVKGKVFLPLTYPISKKWAVE